MAEDCAIKIALSELLPDAIVTNSRIYTNHAACERNEFVQLPKPALDFIKKFDVSKPKERVQINEFAFDIELNEKDIAETPLAFERA